MIKTEIKEKLIQKLKEHNVEADINFYELTTDEGIIPAAKFFIEDAEDGLSEDHFSYENNEWKFTGREKY